MILKRDRAFTVVCEIKTPKEDGTYIVGTGVFVTTPVGDGVSYPKYIEELKNYANLRMWSATDLISILNF